MREERSTESEGHRRRGQTLAEFAISLPLLLILVFGIVEFGRMFQSWVTIQNAARAAARYAVTGRYNEERYDIDTLLPCTVDLDESNLSLSSQSVSYLDADGNPATRNVEVFVSDTPGGEDVYATWYGENDCFPDAESLDRREDMLRLASIYDEAWDASTGLLREGLRTGSTESDPTADDIKTFLYDYWGNPVPEMNERGWFHVDICSNREQQHPDTLTNIVPINADAVPDRRFYDLDPTTEFPYGACIMQEQPDAAASGANNIPDQYGVPWADAGSGGQVVNIGIVYNHPLITPLGLASFVRMSARRSAVNEAFRITNAERSLGPTNPGGPGLYNPTPPTATNTSPPTDTPEPTDTLEPPTPYSSPTEEPFSCDKISVYNPDYGVGSFKLTVRNDNAQDTFIIGTDLQWNESKIKPDFPNIYMGFMQINDDVYWRGTDTTSPTDTFVEGTYFSGADRRIAGRSTSGWEGVFVRGPNILQQYLFPWDFSGSYFFFDHPDPNELDCEIMVTIDPEPESTDPPEGFEPSPTFTPDCASSTLSVEFVSFDPLGDVRFRVVNNRPVVSNLLDFYIVWPSNIPGLKLQRVVAGGTSANDLPPNGNGTVVWQNTSGDATPPTQGSNASDGQWLLDYTFPPNSSTFVHLDFTGTGAPALNQLGASPSQFTNGTWFEISCGREGVGDGSGTPPTGRIFPSELPTPTNTPVPQPTNTPAPTHTPGPTNTPRPTNTPGPTRTPGPTNTPRPPDTPVPPTDPPEDDPGGIGPSE
jgi:hypothetical protein